ncbi:hypothetical protein [Pyrodictium abyssi]|uniref:Uncharacterized protein n=1 Tax=Pyrodictium abyssi TaxID=54256 RepID=A0ABM8IUM8_9CREN|nr:hypothetical protein PABY_08100 [Pyrodictium abyssi]
MPVYMGRDSCYARREGVYVRRLRRPGIDTLREAAGVLRLILRDLRRGWTYEQGTCRKIRMTQELFVQRVDFVPFLAKRHGASGAVLDAIVRLVAYVKARKKLPQRLKVGSRYVDVKRLAEEAIAKVESARR